jgi:mRNA-degrading endonuclease RelE of RelBE toxin-antitoxin system
MSSSWELRASAPARRELERLPVPSAAAVLETLGALASERRGQGTRLRSELDGCFSARRGPYRVVYRVEDAGAVSVLAVTHRDGRRR